MAERRRSGGTRQARPRARRPVDQDEQEFVDEDATEFASPDEQEAFEEDESDADRGGCFADHGGNGNRRAAQQDGSSLTARQAARAALRQMVELTSKHAESITGVERRKDGWTVSIEVVEDRRIPSSADILATYDAEIDGDGELMSYRRVKRYSRGRGDSN
jgi:Gas vesicle synthesis protein GvpO